MDRSLPLLWDCRDLAVVAEGEGIAFARRLFALVAVGAKVTLFSEGEPILEVAMLVAARKVQRKRRPIQKSDLRSASLLLLGSPQQKRSRLLATWAQGAKCRVACLNYPPLGDLYFAASVRWGDLLGAFWDRKKGQERLSFLRRRLQKALPRWHDQAKKALAKPKRRLIRGWIS